MAKGDLIFINHEHEMENKEKIEPILIRLDEVKQKNLGFPGSAVVKNLPANTGDMGSSPGLGRPHMPWSN